MTRPTAKQRFVPKNVEKAPSAPGVYRLYDGPKVKYVGSSRDMSERLADHLASPRFRNITSFDTRRTVTTQEARRAEQRAIHKHKPSQNHR